ncbi:MAG: hypothetical protein Q7S14_01770 [bacterium]|nr:hypothetical protein [bacterium]
MRKIALLILIIIGGFFIYFKKGQAFVSPLGERIYLPALAKALNGIVPVEYSDKLVATVSGVTVIFPKTKEYDNLVRALQTVLNRATMEKKPVEIDLRFDKPILRYGT